MKKLISIFLLISLCFFGSSAYGTTELLDTKQDKLTVDYESKNADTIASFVMTNDIHGGIDGYNKTDGLCYCAAASIKVDKQTETNNHAYLIDAGDHLAGSSQCLIGTDEEHNRGKNIVDIMRCAKYDFSTLGNHEFDFGVDYIANDISKRAEAEPSETQQPYSYYCCNFDSKNGVSIFKPYKIVETQNNKKIALVGIMTPETVAKSAPAYFDNYDVAGVKNPQDLYTRTQQTVNDAKANGADYVIAVGHLGNSADTHSAGLASEDVIKNTNGINFFLDGHSHNKYVKTYLNKDGVGIQAVQMGTEFEEIGIVDVNNEGEFSFSSTTRYPSSKRDTNTSILEQTLITKVNEKLGTKIATTDIDFVREHPDGKGAICKRTSSSLSEICADSMYWYAQENATEDGSRGADVAILNGGAIRKGISSGDINNKKIVDMIPFANNLVVVEASGKILWEAMEHALSAPTEPETSWLSEAGAFPLISGMKILVDSSIESSVQKDTAGNWVAGPTGPYRIQSIEIYNKDTNIYEPIDFNKTYKIAGSSYTVEYYGNGYAMFRGCKVNHFHVVPELWNVISKYISNFQSLPDEANKYAYVSTATSPLIYSAKYRNFMMNLENMYGSGRITYGKLTTSEEGNAQVFATSSTGDNISYALVLQLTAFLISSAVLICVQKKFRK